MPCAACKECGVATTACSPAGNEHPHLLGLKPAVIGYSHLGWERPFTRNHSMLHA